MKEASLFSFPSDCGETETYWTSVHETGFRANFHGGFFPFSAMTEVVWESRHKILVNGLGKENFFQLAFEAAAEDLDRFVSILQAGNPALRVDAARKTARDRKLETFLGMFFGMLLVVGTVVWMVHQLGWSK